MAAFKSKKPQTQNNKSDDTEKNIEINAQMQGSLSFKDPVNLKINGKLSW